MEKVSKLIWQFLADRGVDTVFMVAGGGAMHLVDSLNDFPEIRKVICLHEQAAAIAAVGYAHYTGNVGVCLVTSGPGGTNALTGTLAAWMDSMPVLFLSGNARSDMLRTRDSGLRQLGSQEANIQGISSEITKFSFTSVNPNTILGDLALAFEGARSGRPGPTWLDIPIDVQSAMIDPTIVGHLHEEYFTSGEITRVQPIAYIWEAAEIFREAKRPVIMIGWGAMDLRSKELIDQFLEDYPTVPVLTTWKSMEFLPEDYTSYIGRPGGIGQRAANWTQQYCDFLLCIGCRLDPDQIAFNSLNFAPHAFKVAVDISIDELLKNDLFLDLEICSDAADFMDRFLENLDALQGSSPMKLVWSEWLQICQYWKKTYPVPYVPAKARNLDIYQFIDVLSQKCEEGDLIVLGSSASCANVPCQIWKVKWGQRFIFEPNIGAMGMGLPEALGAGVAQQIQCNNDNKRVILINGDGGFQLNIQELETILANEINLKIFYLNNDGYNSIKNMQERNFGRTLGCDPASWLFLPDIKRIARAYNFDSFRISGGNVGQKIWEVLNSPVSTIVEVMINPDMQQQPRVINEPDPEHPGKFLPTKMENMWPYMEREELKKIEEMALRIK